MVNILRCDWHLENHYQDDFAASAIVEMDSDENTNGTKSSFLMDFAWTQSDLVQTAVVITRADCPITARSNLTWSNGKNGSN